MQIVYTISSIYLLIGLVIGLVMAKAAGDDTIKEKFILVICAMVGWFPCLFFPIPPDQVEEDISEEELVDIVSDSPETSKFTETE